MVMAGPENFMDPGFVDESYYNFSACSANVTSYARKFRQRIQSGVFQSLTTEDCYREYSRQYVSLRGDLFLIQGGTTLDGYRTDQQLVSKQGRVFRMLNGTVLETLFNGSVIDQRHGAQEDLSSEVSNDSTSGDSTASDSTSSDSTSDDSNSDISLSGDSLSSDPLSGGNRTENNGCALYGAWGPFQDAWSISSEDTYLTKSFPYVSDPSKNASNAWQISFPEPSYRDGTITQISGDNITDFSKWTPFNSTVLSCYSERTKEECDLSFSVYITFAVLICMLTKACCMYMTIFWSGEPALRTLGDAIESFLSSPDRHSVGMCAFSASQIQLLWSQERIATVWGDFFNGQDKRRMLEIRFSHKWAAARPRWWRSASPSRFGCFIL